MVLSHSDADHLGAVDKILESYTVQDHHPFGLRSRHRDLGAAPTPPSTKRRSPAPRSSISVAFLPAPRDLVSFRRIRLSPPSPGSRGPSSPGAILARARSATREASCSGCSSGAGPCCLLAMPSTARRTPPTMRPSRRRSSCSRTRRRFPSTPMCSSRLTTVRTTRARPPSFGPSRPRGPSSPPDTSTDTRENVVARRYLAAGVDASRMLRTDRHDNEGGEEWASSCMEEIQGPDGRRRHRHRDFGERSPRGRVPPCGSATGARV